MALIKVVVTLIFIQDIFGQPPELSQPYPILDPTDYGALTQLLQQSKDNNTESLGSALGSTPSYWDGQIRSTNGVNVISTVKSWAALPAALDNALFTIQFMTNSLTSDALRSALYAHNVYIYHCDPTMSTGIGLYTKQGQYDYVSDLLDYSSSTHDGRAVDKVYGYGGVYGSPTSTCDCNVLGDSCSQNAHPSESILVHEFGHTIMNIAVQTAISSLYDQINGAIYTQYRSNVYMDSSDYCGSTAQEMWACGVETWLESTSRQDINPGINTVNEMYANVPLLYNALYQVFGQPPTHLIPTLSSVNSITSNQWTYYDYYINLYGDSTLASQWNSIKYTGSPSTGSTVTTSTTTTTTTRSSVTTTTSSSGSTSYTDGSLGCGETVTGYLAAGEDDALWFYFTYQGGDILFWPCGQTYFASSLSLIDRSWTSYGSDTASSYSGSCTAGYDSTLWVDSSQLSYGTGYWLRVEGQLSSSSGAFAITMYCYNAGALTVTLDDEDSVFSKKTTSLWAIIALVILASLIINGILVYFLVKYCTKKKMEEFERKQSKLISSTDGGDNYNIDTLNEIPIEQEHEEDDDQDEIEIDVEITTR